MRYTIESVVEIGNHTRDPLKREPATYVHYWCPECGPSIGDFLVIHSTLPVRYNKHCGFCCSPVTPLNHPDSQHVGQS